MAPFVPMFTRALALTMLIGAVASIGCNNDTITADAAATPDSPTYRSGACPCEVTACD